MNHARQIAEGTAILATGGSGPRRARHVLVKGDRVELIIGIPGHPNLWAGKRGVVLLAADELQADGLCTVRINGGQGHGTWQLHPRDLRWLGPAPKRRRPYSSP